MRQSVSATSKCLETESVEARNLLIAKGQGKNKERKLIIIGYGGDAHP
jgi:hypothetical protein